MASERVTKFLEEIDLWTVIELSELVKGLEDKFGVSAAEIGRASCRERV